MTICAMHSRILLALLALAAVTPTQAATPAAVDATVEIRAFAFAPKEITVTTGTTILWINQDATPHALGATDRTFTSPGMDTGDRYRHTFGHPGDFPYFCTLHPFMTGIVHVRAAASEGNSGQRRSR